MRHGSSQTDPRTSPTDAHMQSVMSSWHVPWPSESHFSRARVIAWARPPVVCDQPVGPQPLATVAVATDPQ